MLALAYFHQTSAMTSDVRGASSAWASNAPAYDDSVGHRMNPRPRVPRVRAGLMYALHRVLEPNPLWRAFARLLERSPPLYKAFTWTEERTKSALFGCRMCGQCALPTTGYACPQTCPKQLRNGPCGGVSASGNCEVYPEMRCVWVEAYERAATAGHSQDLRRLVRPIDHGRWGQSSWVNFWLDRDEGLWTEDDGLDAQSPPRL